MPANSVIRFRRGTAAQWTSANPVLALAEPGYETDTGKEKRGNGTSAWTALPYFVPGNGTFVQFDGTAGQLTLGGQPAPAVAAGSTRLSPLGNIGKALTGPFRVYLMGTSLANFDYGIPKVFAELLRERYGAARWTFQQAGALGGSYDADYSGWKKQRYGGNIYHRSRADSTATAFTLEFYGDYFRAEFSRETDSTAVAVLLDGSSVGSSPAAGAQAYRQAVTWTGTAGYHIVTFNVPAGAGFVYLETFEAGLSTRTGVEYIDSTLGGSGMQHAINVWAKSAGQTATPIAISGNNGLDYHFTRTDIDLYVVEHDMNDGTYSLWKQGIDYVIAQTKSRGVPLVLIGEPHNDYATNTAVQQKRNYLLSVSAAYGHVTVIDWHPMLAAAGDVTAMNTLYYGGSAGPNYPHPVQGVAYTTGVDALCRASGIPTPRAGVKYTGPDVVRARLAKPLDSSEQTNRNITVGAGSIVLPPVGRTVRGATLASQDTWDTSSYLYRINAAGSEFDMTSSITAAGTSDTFGAYLDAGAGQNIFYQPSAGNIGTTMRFTVLACADGTGKVQFGFDKDYIRFEDGNGTALPVNAGQGRRVVIFTAPPVGSAPAAYTLVVRSNVATALNVALLNGRFYGGLIAAASDAVLPYANGVPLQYSGATAPWVQQVLPWMSPPRLNTSFNPLQGAYFGGGMLYNDSSQNSLFGYDLLADAGTYTFRLVHSKGPALGIATIAMDDGAGNFAAVPIGTIDCYAAGNSDNNITNLTGIAIPGPFKKRTLRLIVATKNASSTNYGMAVHAISLNRTA